MKVIHLIGGGDVGGAKTHVLSLVKELGKYADVKIISFRPGIFTDDAIAMGINIEVVRTGNIISDIKRVADIIKASGYELIHSHGAKANMVSAILRDMLDIPTVTTVHSDYRLDYLQSKYKMFSFGLINMLALRFIDFYIGVSKNYREMLIKRGFNPSRIYTLYNGIDFSLIIPAYTRSEFSKKYNVPLDEDDTVIGILARLDPVKGLDVLLNAAAIVLKQNTKVKFLIGGDGEQRIALERKAASLGIADNVFFLGWVDKYEFLNCIDINVLTSLSESFPYAILEGTQLGKATVSSDVGGLSDLIDSGRNGFLFKPGDYKKFADQLLAIIKNPRLRNEMGEKLKRKAQEKFSLNSMCQTQLGIYRNILALHGKNRLKDKKKYDVIISGYYGFKNSGDEAILAAIINNLRLFKKDISINVLSMNPPETRNMYGVDSVNRFNPFQFIPAIKNSSLFMYGGGNLIQDDTSTRSLLYYLGVVWLAKKMRLKVMFYANGIGPLNGRINKKLTQKILNRVDVITLREELSMKELDKLHITRPKIYVTADAALNIEAVDENKTRNIFINEGIDLPGTFVGISIRDVSMLSKYAHWNRQEKFNEIIAQIADHLIESYGVKPVFIPMQYPEDFEVIKNVVSKMKGIGYIIKNKYSEPEMFGIIKQMDVLIGMRLHSLIYAASVGIPVIGLVYEPKVEGFLQSVQQVSAGDIKDLEYESFKVLVDDIWNRKDEIKKQVYQVTSQLKAKALENAKIAIDLIEE